jgi:hypothetical protein
MRSATTVTHYYPNRENRFTTLWRGASGARPAPYRRAEPDDWCSQARRRRPFPSRSDSAADPQCSVENPVDLVNVPSLAAAHTEKRRGPTQDRAAEENRMLAEGFPTRLHAVRPMDLHRARSLTARAHDPPRAGGGGRGRTGRLSALRSPISASSDCRTPEQKSHCCFPVDLRHCRRSRLAPGRGPGVRAPTRPAFGRGKRAIHQASAADVRRPATTATVQAGQAPATRSNLAKSIDLLTLRLILVDLAANAIRECRKGYSVRSDGGTRPDVGGAV